MIDLGSELRQAREEKGISLAEAENGTRIKACYLQALEVNDWAALPTQVQARGFLRNYAVFLGLSEDEVMAKFSQVIRGASVSLPAPPAADSPVPTTDPDGAVFRPRDIDIEGGTGGRSWLSSDIVIGVALAVVVAVLGFGLVRLVFGISNENAAEGTATPSLLPGAAGGTPQATTGTGVLLDDATLAPATPTFDASIGSLQLDLEAMEHVWVRVTVDGTQVLEGILAPDAPQSWQGTDLIILETANGAGLAAVVNGQPQGSLGERGQAVVLAWGPNGQVSLTPTPGP
jgi:hypothetical protein